MAESTDEESTESESTEERKQDEEHGDCSAIVIDPGSYASFGGFSGEDTPRIVQPSVVGLLKNTKYAPNQKGQKNVYVGDEAFLKKKIVSLKYPIERGIVTNWDHLEKLWSSMFHDELRAEPEEHHIFLTEHPLSSKSQRENKTEIMFEKFNAPSFYIGVSSLLSLYASGRMTGVVLESGHSVTYSVPCYEGVIIPNAIQRLELGGLEITDFLVKKLKQNAQYVSIYGSAWKPSFGEKRTVRSIKEKLCYIAVDYDEEVSKSQNSLDVQKIYELPDGQKITINDERFECPEILFNPFLCGMEQKGVANMIYESILKCDCDIYKKLWNNIVISGGNTRFNGFKERLQNDLEALLKMKKLMEIKVISPPERKYSAWIGGSVLAALSSFESMWIRKEEYNECGPSIVHQKCT